MRCLKLKIDWNYGCSNNPAIRALVNRIPETNDLRYRKKGHLYYAELDGFASFFSYNGPGEGYGGACFRVILEDGTVEVLKGPWSSSPSTVNAAGFGPCLPLTVTEEPEVWRRGYTFFAAACTVAWARNVLDLMKPEIEIIRKATESRDSGTPDKQEQLTSFCPTYRGLSVTESKQLAGDRGRFDAAPKRKSVHA